MQLSWYYRRLTAMSLPEIVDRSKDAARRQLWIRLLPTPPRKKENRSPVFVPPTLDSTVKQLDQEPLLRCAEGLLSGRWKTFTIDRDDYTAELDYYIDPTTGLRAPSEPCGLVIDHRQESAVGNIKNVWEPARHQHLTVLAAAYANSKDERFADRIATELSHYWEQTPFCQGIHWTSGIEMGIRLLSWSWIRRLLDPWPQAKELFETNPVFVEQLGRHHQWLNAFEAHGSSANNHLIAEAAGAFVATSCFDLFEDGDLWRSHAAEVLIREVPRQTFPDGFNRELASEYHGFVLELATAAYAEARFTDHHLAAKLQPSLQQAFNALAAAVDCIGEPHHQGDADEAHGLLFDPPSYNRWHSLLHLGRSLFEPQTWWPSHPETDARTPILASGTPAKETAKPATGNQPSSRPNHFAHAGLTFLRDDNPDADELWVRFDHGPHGYLATAAHAHADALSVEVRHRGIPIVVDPGTYCYHGEPEWRDYFRSTRAHSTVEIGRQDQSEIGGPFLWTSHCPTQHEKYSGFEAGTTTSCTASHDGYLRSFGLRHRRTVAFDRQRRVVAFTDQIRPPQPTASAGQNNSVNVRVLFHFHPDVTVEEPTIKDPQKVVVCWPSNHKDGAEIALHQGVFSLDSKLRWTFVKGQESPPLGWYSRVLGEREPTWVLVGETTVGILQCFNAAAHTITTKFHIDR